MNLDPFTSPDEVRAVLGVSSEELEDATINLGVFGMALSDELAELSPNLTTLFLAIGDKTLGRTATDDKLWRRVRMFATYATAKAVASGLPMFGVKDLTDGKAGFSRFADSPYRAAYERVLERYAVFRKHVLDVLVELNEVSDAGTVTPSLLVGAGPATDRVTNA